MAKRNIIKVGDEVLRKPTRSVDRFDAKLWALLDDMNETMKEAAGCGLAASQIGILRKIFIADNGNGLIECINPEIIFRSEEEISELEGCLSIPDRQEQVARPKEVRLRYFDRNGKQFELSAEGYLARIICHEYDHLSGILYIDRVKKGE